MGSANFSSTCPRGEIMTIVTVGIDLAKNVFAVHGVNATGKPVLLRPSVPRVKLAELIASLPPCLIGMEACSGAHHWARQFRQHGHTVHRMAPSSSRPTACPASAARTTRRTPPPSVKRYVVPTCASSRSRKNTSRWGVLGTVGSTGDRPRFLRIEFDRISET